MVRGRNRRIDSIVDIKWLEDFLSLADSRSFSRSAHERHVTQPAFSRRIRALEAWAGYSDRLLHGEAVAIGICLAFELSR